MKLKRGGLVLLALIIVTGTAACNKPQAEDATAGNVTEAPATQESNTDLTQENSTDLTQEAVTEADTAPEPEMKTQIPENIIAFSRTNNFYSESIEVEILSDKTGKIYYTTDGTEVSEEKTLYADTIKLNSGNMVTATCIKAKAFFEDGTESETIVQTYFVGADVESRYDTLIFSVTTDPYNLYDYEYGIFTDGKLRDDFISENPGVEPQPNDPANFNIRGKAAEREVYLEVFDPNGTAIIDQTAGIRTYGGWSRAREQKSFKIFARKEYDELNNKLRYEFFPSRASLDGSIIDTFKQLVLRNSGNDNGFAFIRDELFQTLAAQAGYQDYEAVRPAAVYVNGDYRGFFWLHEVYSDEYFEDHYGTKEGSFEILEGADAYKNYDDEGENTDIVDDYNDFYYTYASMDLTDDNNYQKVCEVIDVKNYLEYFAFQTYISNEDWPHNNYKAYRYFAAEGEEYGEAPIDGKWRYLLHDLDFSFGIYGTGATINFLDKYIGKNGEIRESCPLFGQLMKRADCKQIFVEKTLDLVNGVFDPVNLNRVLDDMNEKRMNELTNTYNKSLLEDWVTYDQLEDRINDIKSWAAIHTRSTISNYQNQLGLKAAYTLTVKATADCKAQINKVVTASDFEGTYFTDYDVIITPILPEGKVVDYWMVNGEKMETDVLIVTPSMVKNETVKVFFVTK